MKKKKESLLDRLFTFAGPYRYLTIVSMALAAVSAWIGMIPFYYIWKIIREVLAVRPDFAQAVHIKGYGYLALIYSLISMLLYIVALFCSHMAAFRVQANMRIAMMEQIMKLPFGYIESKGTGKIRKIVVDSSGATETYLAHNLPDKAVSIATPVGLLILLFVFDWRLGLFSLIPAALGFFFMGSMMGKEMQESMKEYQDALETMSGEAVEYVRGIPVVKAFGQSIYSFRRFKNAIDNYETWTIDYTKKMMKPMVGFTTAINATFVFLIVAAYLFTGHGVSDAFILNLLFYIIITPVLTVTLMKMAYAGEAQMMVEDALKRMDEIMEQDPLPQPKQSKMTKDASVKFEEVSFAYKDADKKALDGIDLSIKAGEHVAFVGPSGGGKTTIASLIARFWDVKEGSIKIGGVDVRDMTDEELMEEVSYVFQDSKLLKMSIFENVKLGRADATKEEVMRALEKAQCMDIIEKFPNGIDTIIGTNGVFVSGGEAQRLSIARAFLKDAPILILDEATAFADPDNEEKVQKAFDQLSKEKTVIMIAHRLSTITNVDRIYVLQEGKIVQSGKHETLIQETGVYKDIWEKYNQSVKWKVGKEV